MRVAEENHKSAASVRQRESKCMKVSQEYKGVSKVYDKGCLREYDPLSIPPALSFVFHRHSS